MRPKWDEVHYADGATYGKKTIERAIATTSEFYDPDPENDAPHSTSSDQSSTDVGAGDSDRSSAYLAEKNRLLTDRVDDLETALAQKTERIEILEAKIERLKDERVARNQATGESSEEHTSTENEESGRSENPSVWRRLFGSRFE